jgi:hypothetical protein
MKTVLHLAFMAALGMALGYGAMVGAMVYKSNYIGVYNGNSWMTAKGIGSREADILLKALIAKIGIFANSKEEAIYFQAFVGDPKVKMNGSRHYRVIGNKSLPAAWWSCTLYDSHNYLFSNPENRYAFADFNLDADPDGAFVIDIAPVRPAGARNWLPSPPGEDIAVTLRIYEPGPEIYDHMETFALPQVEQVN